MKPKPTVPTHMPAKKLKTKKPTPWGEKKLAPLAWNSPLRTNPGVM